MDKFFKKPKVFIPTFIIAVFAVIITIRLSSTSSPPLNGFSSAQIVLPVPTLVPIQDASFKTEVHSPDGAWKVVLEKIVKSQVLAKYTIFVAEISGANEKIIFSKTLDENKAIQIPENSWSPDNKYLLLKENDSGKLSFFVLKATGETFTDGKEYIDVVSLFDSKKYGYNLSDITGWDSDILLHIFTVSENGTRGPSFWFDVEGKYFSILSSR